MGSGTVMVAARQKGHRAFGLDIDPLAVLVSRVWANAVDERAVRRAAKATLSGARKMCQELSVRDGYPADADDETKQFVRYWFDPYVRRQLASLANAIKRCRHVDCKDVLWCAFSRLIVTKQAGESLALDLAHSRPHRHFERAPIKPFAAFLKAVERVLQNCLSLKQRKRGFAPRVHLGDARCLALRDCTIDLVLTSPPYLNAIDYFRCSKFSLVWMGYSVAEIRLLRKTSVGTEAGQGHSESESVAQKLIAHLRIKARLSERQKAVLSRYICDMDSSIGEVSRVLKPGGKAIYVIGENTVRGVYIPNAKIIIALAKKAGLILTNQSRRTLPPNRRYLPPPARNKRRATLDRRMRRELVLHFVKQRRAR